MFTVKIMDGAKRVGLTPVFVKSRETALAQAESNPVAMILDLNYAAADPLELIASMKASEKTRGIPLLGFVSHVQIELRQAAEASGCDIVVARSTFSEKLPQLLSRYVQIQS